MNFNTVYPLSFTSALAVTTSLYYHQNLHYYEGLTATTMLVTENINQLPAPQTVKEEIQRLVQVVGEEICSWVWEFRSIIPRELNFFKKFSWTPLGALDHCKTASNCISSCDIDRVLAFKLACTSGSVEHILRLWPDVKHKMLKDMAKSRYRVGLSANSVCLWTSLWTAYLNDEMDVYRRANNETYDIPLEGYDNHVKFICRKAVDKVNIGTALYFIEKLRTEHKQQVIKGLVSACIKVHGRDFDATLFLSLMYRIEEEDAKELLLKYQTDLLLHFLKWPMQNYFLQYVDFLLPAFPFDCVTCVMDRLTAKIMQGQATLAYENILQTFWRKMPSDEQRKYFNRNLYYTFTGLFRPYTVEHVISDLFKCAPNAYDHFASTVIGDAGAVMLVLIEENKFKAFKTLLEKYFLQEKLTDKLEEKYTMYTQTYVNEYYGIFTSESSSESGLDY